MLLLTDIFAMFRKNLFFQLLDPLYYRRTLSSPWNTKLKMVGVKLQQWYNDTMTQQLEIGREFHILHIDKVSQIKKMNSKCI